MGFQLTSERSALDVLIIEGLFKFNFQVIFSCRECPVEITTQNMKCYNFLKQHYHNANTSGPGLSSPAVDGRCDSRLNGCEFESHPRCDVHLCSSVKQLTTNCPCLLGQDTKSRKSLLPGVYITPHNPPQTTSIQ